MPPFVALENNGTATQAQIDDLEAGFALALAQIDANVMTQVFAEKLPIVGDNFLAAAGGGAVQLHYLEALKTAIVSGLGTLVGSGTYTDAQVKSAIDAALTAASIGGLGATVDFSDSTDIVLRFVTTRNYGALATPIKTDFGLPNLGLKTTGTAETLFAYQYNFSVGLDGSGFYVATGPGTTNFWIEMTTRLPGLSANAEMASILLHAEDVPARRSDFYGKFDLTVKDPNNDGRLRTGELGGVLVDATLTGGGGVKLDLDSILPPSAAMPAIGTQLSINWKFLNSVVNPLDDNTAFGSAPEVHFNNNTINLGSFFDVFAGRILDEITRVTGPLQPVIDVLDTPLPILSDLGSDDVTLLDFAGLDPDQTAAIKGLSDIISLANLVATFDNDGMVEIDLGSLKVGGDLRTDLPADVGLTIVRQGALPSSQNAHASEFLSAVRTLGGGGLSFPVLSDPEIVGDLLLGHDVDLFAYKTSFGFDEEFSQYYPVLGFIGVKLGGHFGMAATFDFGFDTQGLKDYALSGYTDATKVFNGFYVRATDDEGEPVTGFQVSAGLIAGIEANIGFAEAGVDGDLTATVDFALSGFLDPTGTQKVRGGTLATTFVGDLFSPGGELTTGLRAYLEIGISPFSVEFSFDSPRVTLLNFDGDNTNPPIIASPQPNGDLALNVGPRSAHRVVGNLLDRAETVEIHNALNPITNDMTHLRLEAFKFSESHAFPTRITGDGGEHSDVLALDADVNIPAVFSGGANRDFLTGGAADDILNGDEGPDVLSGNGGVDMLYGGHGSDKLIGGADGDYLDGGDGEDTASYATATAGMIIDLRTMTFTGDGVGDTLVSIERYEGTNFADVIDGNDGFNGFLSGLDGDDIIRGHGGDDLLDGGKGDDSLFGGTGNDFLVGGPGADAVDGGDGIDTVAYTSSKTPVVVSLRTGLGTGGDAQGDTLTNVEVLIGSPLPYGDLKRFYDANGRPLPNGTGDTLEGSDGPDLISGLGGADFIDGGAGNDWLYGNSNLVNGALPSTVGLDADTLRGGAGDDMLFGQEDNDDLDGGPGYDILDGGDGNDHLRTFDLGSVDELDGGPGINRLSADYSDKTVPITWIAGQTNDYTFADGDLQRNFQNIGELHTGNQPDVIRLDGAADDGFNNIIHTNGGDDRVHSGAGDDHIVAGNGHDMIDAGAGNDYVDAGDGDDFVNSGSNRTILSFPGGVPLGSPGDTLHGGAGNDTLSFEDIEQFQGPTPYIAHPLGVRVNLATNATGLGASGTVISGFENVIGTNFRDELTGDDGPNILSPLRGGGYGNGGGNFDPDFIDGAGGVDTLLIDFSLADLPNALGIVTAGRGFYRNTIGNLAILDNYGYVNIERLDITGASKNDVIYTFEYGYNDVLRGLAGDDVLGGYGGSDTLLGGDGNDVLTAQGQFTLGYSGTAGGRDFLDGGTGDDEVENFALATADRPAALAPDAYFQLDGGPGFDTFSADFSNQTEAIVWNSTAPADIVFSNGAFAKNFEQLRHFAGGSGNDAITQLGRFNNIIYTNAGNDIVAPGLGTDRVDGGLGDDLLVLDFSVGDNAAYAGVYGGGNFPAFSRDHPGVATIDYVYFSAFERLHLTGTSHNDTIDDFAGDDVISGGPGNDIISSVLGGNNAFHGGEGNDTLNGGSGNDILTGGHGTGSAGLTEIDRLRGGDGLDLFVLGDEIKRFYDDQLLGNPGTGAYAYIEDFTPSQGDHLRLYGSAEDYLLGISPIAGRPGTALYHDTNDNGTLDVASDELIAILASPVALTTANTLGTAAFVQPPDFALIGLESIQTTLLDDGFGERFVLQFSILETVPPGLLVEIQVSTDLGLTDPWHVIASKHGPEPWTGPSIVTVSPPSAGKVVVTVPALQPLRDVPKQFFRVSLSNL